MILENLDNLENLEILEILENLGNLEILGTLGNIEKRKRQDVLQGHYRTGGGEAAIGAGGGRRACGSCTVAVWG